MKEGAPGATNWFDAYLKASDFRILSQEGRTLDNTEPFHIKYVGEHLATPVTISFYPQEKTINGLEKIVPDSASNPMYFEING